mmetsp:Transcript_36051/g.80235  ORF Transcript_36051/g.80235 Transcript_36051/m.80235 type:complete len:234 (-) Transcript_36051:1272-1973(-)
MSCHTAEELRPIMLKRVVSGDYHAFPGLLQHAIGLMSEQPQSLLCGDTTPHLHTSCIFTPPSPVYHAVHAASWPHGTGIPCATCHAPSCITHMLPLHLTTLYIHALGTTRAPVPSHSTPPILKHSQSLRLHSSSSSLSSSSSSHSTTGAAALRTALPPSAGTSRILPASALPAQARMTSSSARSSSYMYLSTRGASLTRSGSDTARMYSSAISCASWPGWSLECAANRGVLAL